LPVEGNLVCAHPASSTSQVCLDSQFTLPPKGAARLKQSLVWL
jgi:hypothetical protein